MTGPLAGLRVVELAAIGPTPFAAMMLSDMGADVLRIDRGPQAATSAIDLMTPDRTDVLHRGRPSVGVDLQQPEGRDLVLTLASRADALLEGFRPGVMERLGLGPEVVCAAHPRLVYGRMTGYGQTGPLASVAGHDINYISVAGALGAIAREHERPLFPLNLLADFGGGGMLLAFGVVCAMLEAQTSHRGQVVDAAMVDGVALLTAMVHGLRARGAWADRPGTNLVDSGAHFYEVYETADGGHVAVGAVEPQFYSRLLELMDLDAHDCPQWERSRWPELKLRFAAVFAAQTRSHWAALLESEDACATAVLLPAEAPDHPHLRHRGTFVDVAGVTQPAPAPRLSRTPGTITAPPSERGADTRRALLAWGVPTSDVDVLTARGVIG